MADFRVQESNLQKNSQEHNTWGKIQPCDLLIVLYYKNISKAKDCGFEKTTLSNFISRMTSYFHKHKFPTLPREEKISNDHLVMMWSK